MWHGGACAPLEITGVDLDTAPLADLMSDRAERTEGRGTGDEITARRDGRMETGSAEEEEGS